MAELYADLVDQDAAVQELRSAAASPVHAYFLVGPAGTGKRAGAVSFAASLLCRKGGCGACMDCRQALSESHPDLAVVERRSAALEIDDVREVIRLASTSPPEGQRQVVIIVDVHLARVAGPALLKTIEEPSRGTVFVLTGEPLPPGLATLASRCVRVAFRPARPEAISAWLVSRGTDQDTAAKVSLMAQGSSARASALAEDPGAVARYDLWRSVLGKLDASGATTAHLADQLLSASEESLSVLRTRQAGEIEALSRRNSAIGEPASRGRKELEERHHREERRWRTDEIRSGLGALAGACRDRLIEIIGDRDSIVVNPDASRLLRSVASVNAASRALVRNPNEPLLLQALLVKISSSAGD
ncbi:MAG: hypothetical protein ACYDEY_04350 [Acidimicrobiales bacterium]